MSEHPVRRGDLLASFCFVENADFETELERLGDFAQKLSARFQYWEIVYAVGEQRRPRIDAAGALVSRVKNLRIVLVSDTVNLYRRRVIAASESIGDAVVISSFDEMGSIDLVALAERAFDDGEVIMCRLERGTSGSLLHAGLRVLTNYEVDNRDLQTIAVPRRPLDDVLRRPAAALDLRFEPKRAEPRYLRQLCHAPELRRKGRRSPVAERYGLAAELIATSAPRILKGYAALSSVVVLGALLYALYTVVTIIAVDGVQQGWFSTNFVQALSVGFIALGIAILCLGVAEIYERMQGRARLAVSDEIANISYFEQADIRNVVEGSKT